MNHVKFALEILRDILIVILAVVLIFSPYWGIMLYESRKKRRRKKEIENQKFTHSDTSKST